MQYRFATEDTNYEDYAAGRVLLTRPGATSFPVRLASEIYQRCAAVLKSQGNPGPYRIYDPCCGTGYLLAVLGFLHGGDFAAIFASDIDAEMIEVARRNLAMLTPDGLDKRIAQLEDYISQFGKDSHLEARQSAARLSEQLKVIPPSLEIACFTADATQLDIALLELHDIDLVITDVPYGGLAQWQEGAGGDPIGRMLESLRPHLAKPSVVAVISDKAQSAGHDAYRRVERFPAGKRRVTILQPG